MQRSDSTANKPHADLTPVQKLELLTTAFEAIQESVNTFIEADSGGFSSGGLEGAFSEAESAIADLTFEIKAFFDYVDYRPSGSHDDWSPSLSFGQLGLSLGVRS